MKLRIKHQLVQKVLKNPHSKIQLSVAAFVLLFLTGTFAGFLYQNQYWYEQKSIGTIKTHTGDLHLERLLESYVISKGDLLFSGDRLQTGKSSSLVIELRGGHLIRAGEQSDFRIHFEKNSKGQLNHYLEIQKGNVSKLKKGNATKLTMINTNPSLIKVAPTESDKENFVQIEELESPQEPLPVESQFQNSKILSNDKIQDEVIRHSSLLQRCQINSLRDYQQLSGRLVVNFTILPEGKTEDVKVKNSSFNSNEFSGCIVSVFERMGFRNFEGDKIQVNYPLEFK